MQVLRSVSRLGVSQQPRKLLHHQHHQPHNQKGLFSTKEKKQVGMLFLHWMKWVPVMNVLTPIRNSIIAFYVRRQLGHQFHIREFLNACPQAIRTVAEILPEAGDDETRKENLKEMMSVECLEKVVKNWNGLEECQQAEISHMDPDLCLLYEPQLKIVHADDGQCLLRARLSMMHLVDVKQWGDGKEALKGPAWMTSMIRSEPFAQWLSGAISRDIVELERDVTHGVTDSNWRIVYMKYWPKVNRLF